MAVMSYMNTDKLYELLPAIYRLRDGEQGPLRALIEVLSHQAEDVEDDITRLYENWFIETCGDWAVPYIGDLLGVRGLLSPERAGWSQRALVANTLQYRQRKGTVPVLEQLAHDAAGWDAHAVEFYNRVSATQYLDHLRPGQAGTADLRSLSDPARVGSPFDPLAYTPDVRLMSGTRQAPAWESERPISWLGRRSAEAGEGRPNLPNIGLYVWRLKTYRVQRGTAFSHGDGQRFNFSPLGNDIQLFNHPLEKRDFSESAHEHELPVALYPDVLDAELRARREASRKNKAFTTCFFGDSPVFEIFLPKEETAIPPEELIICDLSNWSEEDERPDQPEGKLRIKAAVDPVLGRIVLADEIKGELRVSYAYAFSDDIGGGPYLRDNGMQLNTTLIQVSREKSLEDALKKAVGLPQAVIQLTDSATYTPMRSGWEVNLGACQLTLCAAEGCRPVLMGDLGVQATSASSQLTLNGLLIAGQVKLSGPLGKLTIADCTLVPGFTPKVKKKAGNEIQPSLVGIKLSPNLSVTIEHSILGPILLPKEIQGLSISDSIVDAPESGSMQTDPLVRAAKSELIPNQGHFARPDLDPGQLPAIAGDEAGKKPGPSTCLKRVTVFGMIRVSAMPLAEDVLFTKPVKVSSKDGQARHCYPPARLKLSDRQLPAFTARRYGEPGYAQLSLDCPAEIRAGGTDGAEIGVFHNLHQPQREAALLAQTEEYLRFGLEVGLIYVN